VEHKFSGGNSGATYSTVANIPRAKKQKYVAEGNAMLGGAKKCRELWATMRKADFRKEGVLNETNIELVVDKNKDIFQDLLRLNTPAEIIDVFDTDKDGFLNEDE